MTFRLTTLLYLFAMLAASMAVFGELGLLLGFWFFWGWKCFKRDPAHYKTPLGIVQFVGVFIILPVIMVALFQPGIARGPGPRGPHNLKQLAFAIHNYHEEHGHFPPPYVADDNGKPLYSWRVLLLPYLEQQQPVAAQFHYDEPWDSLHNQQFLGNLSVFESGWKSTGEAHFLAIVAAGTIWDPSGTVSSADVTDGLDKTLLLMEIPSQGIHWSEPRDLSLDEALALLQDDTWKERTDKGYFATRHYRVRTAPACLAATADGAVYHLPPGINRADAEAFLTRAGGESLEPLDDPQRRHERTVIHWHRISNVALWIAIVLLPFNRRLAIFPAKKEEQEAQLREMHSPEAGLHEE